MSRLMVPISSPTRTSTRESAARAERAKPTPAPAASRPAPAATAPPTNSRLLIFIICGATRISETDVGESFHDLPQLRVLARLLRLAQALEGGERGLRVLLALEPHVGATELVVRLGHVGVETRGLLKLRDGGVPALGAHVEPAEREARGRERRVEFDGPPQVRLDARGVRARLFEQRLGDQVVGGGELRVCAQRVLVERDGLGVGAGLRAHHAEVGEGRAELRVEFGGALEGARRLRVLVELEMREAEREPEARRVGEVLER